jgi:hypothetical protein
MGSLGLAVLAGCRWTRYIGEDLSRVLFVPDRVVHAQAYKRAIQQYRCAARGFVEVFQHPVRLSPGVRMLVRALQHEYQSGNPAINRHGVVSPIRFASPDPQQVPPSVPENTLRFS